MSGEPNPLDELVRIATDRVTSHFALFRDPKYGTELVRSEYEDVVRVALQGALGCIGSGLMQGDGTIVHPRQHPDDIVARIFAEQNRRWPDDDPGDLIIGVQDDMPVVSVQQHSRTIGLPVVGGSIEEALLNFERFVFDRDDAGGAT